MKRKIQDDTPRPLEWGEYIIRPTDPKCRRSEVPHSCGVYAWYSRDGDLLYVGRSVRMGSRLKTHHMTSWGGVWLSYRLVPEKWLDGVEMAHIRTLAPIENVAREGCGLPFWDELCAAIDAAWRDVLPAQKERALAVRSAINEQIASRL